MITGIEKQRVALRTDEENSLKFILMIRNHPLNSLYADKLVKKQSL